MKVKVTKDGIIIPKKLLKEAKEVDIRDENNVIIIVPLTKSDPIYEFGQNPVSCGLKDASEKHDKYIYNPLS